MYLSEKWFIYFFEINTKFYKFICINTNKSYAAAAGAFCTIKNKEFSKNLFFVKLPSKFCFFFDMFSCAFLGRCSNIYYRYTYFASFSGKFRVKKKYQSTRGIAMNPVDHPNGGRSKVKKPFRNPWGYVAKKGK